MDVKVCHNVELDLSESFILEEEPSLQLNGKVKVNGIGVFDDNGRILPLISKYLSYQSKHEKISYKSAGNYGKNLVYFLNYIRNRSDYNSEETDEVFITVPKYVIQEYLSFLDREEDKSSATVRNRDATIRAFIEFLCNPTEDREPLRENNPYINGYLSKAPKRTPINACTLDVVVN